MNKHKLVVINGDGGSRGNPGPAASGIVFSLPDGTVLGEYSRFLGHTTNNQAEYDAVILALENLDRYPAESYHFYMDSKLVVEQLSGNWKVKHPDIKPLVAKILREISDKGLRVKFEHVLRDKNKSADAMVNQCLDTELL